MYVFKVVLFDCDRSKLKVADLITVKIHVNSVISDIISRYMCMDVKYFYLNNCMKQA